MPKNRSRSKQPGSAFYGWHPLQIVGFATIILGSLLLAVLGIPLGLVFLGLIFLLPKAWVDPNGSDDPTYGQVVQGSRAYRRAMFFQPMKDKDTRNHIFSPLVMLGFGAPEDDIIKNVEASFFKPPARMAAYWAICFGICIAYVDYLAHPFTLLKRFGFSTPAIVSAVISALCFFMAFQALNVARRYQMGVALPGVDHTPAVMINKIPRKDLLKSFAIGNGVVGLITTGVTMGVLYTLSSSVSFITMSQSWIFALIFGIGVGIFYQFRLMTKQYRQEFDYQIKRRNIWQQVWGFKKDQMPMFEMEVPIPSVEGAPNTSPQAKNADTWVATFTYPVNGKFGYYIDNAEDIKTAIPNAKTVAIIPIPQRNSITGEIMEGTASSDGFRVWWTSEDINTTRLLTDRTLTEYQMQIGVRSAITDKISSVVKQCLVHSFTMMTSPESRIQVMELNLVPSIGIVESKFNDNIRQIQDALGVKWVRVKSSTDDNDKTIITLYVATDDPNSPDIIYPEFGATNYREQLLRANWSYSYHINKITSPAGSSPELMLSRAVTDRSDELVFSLPAGVSYADVIKKMDAIKTSSGNTYMEIHEGLPDKKHLSSEEQEQINRFCKTQGSLSQFTAVAAPTHPLEKKFYFSEYKDILITGRERGVAKIEWSPGVKSNGQLAKHSFAEDMAHLVIAGSSGSGKSVLIYSALCQLIANNYPEDLQIWIVDPKVGFGYYEHIDTVTRYVDSWTPDGNFFQNVRNMLYDAAKEMARRNEIFRFADTEDPIDKLDIARRVAIEQGPLPDGSPNPLMQPYLIIVIDEVAMLFADAQDKETKDLQGEILFYASKLARESRSAGIHCIFATQYPTKQSLPSLIKQQSGRIGLQTQDAVASKVIIDQPGLEAEHLKRIKGSGKVLEGGTYSDFRGFLMEDDSVGEHSMMEILNSVPSRKTNDNASSTDVNAVTIPEPDKALFAHWDSTAAGKSMANDKPTAREQKITKLMDDLQNMPKEQFEALTFDDFTAMLPA